MFARASAAFFLALPLLVAALPSDQCNTGSIHCCEQVQDVHHKQASGILGLLGIDVQALTGDVGLTCSPLSIVGLNSNSCTSQPVCCTGNDFNGLIVIGCSPINVNL